MSKLISLSGLQTLIEKLKSYFLTEEDVLMEGPDGNFYKLTLDDDFRLMLEEKVSARQVTYLSSNNEYYYLTEDESGIYLSKYDGIPNNEDCGVVVAISKDTGMKFIVGVEGGNVTFTLCEDPGIILKNSAKYMICNDKICYFEIKDDQVHILYEYLTIETDNIKLK